MVPALAGCGRRAASKAAQYALHSPTFKSISRPLIVELQRTAELKVGCDD